MNDKKWIVAGIVIFLVISTFPFWFNLGKAAPPPEIELTAKAKAAKVCVQPTDYMKANHMQVPVLGWHRFCHYIKATRTRDFSRINPFYKKEIVLSEAEFGLFFEGADLEKRFIESPKEISKKVSLSPCHRRNNDHINRHEEAT